MWLTFLFYVGGLSQPRAVISISEVAPLFLPSALARTELSVARYLSGDSWRAGFEPGPVASIDLARLVDKFRQSAG